MKINKKIIEELVGYLKEFNLSEIEYSEGSTKVKISKSINNSATVSPVVKEIKLETKEDEWDDCGLVRRVFC